MKRGAGSNQFTEYRYNALGQRSEQIEKTGTTETAHYYQLYEGSKLLCRYSGGTAIANIDRQYLEQGEQRKSAGTWASYYYTHDHLGSIREVMNSDGSLAARYDFDPYGKRQSQYQSAAYSGGCDLGFTGHITQASPVPGQSELVLTLFRAYDPQLGRWLSCDPLGEKGGMNLYGYVLGNPVNFRDPNGKFPSAVWWGGFFDFDQGTLDALEVGAMATADGIIPFADPFQNSGSYDPCQDGVGFSQAAGGFARDVALIAATGGGSTFGNVAAQAKNPILYELGSTTVSPGTWRFLKYASVTNRGRILAAKYGGIYKAFKAESSFGRALPNIGSGLTPAGSIFVSGSVHGLDSAKKLLSGDDSKCPRK
jgi:RHS repeat-associated protein